eukprot:SAG31_NODE_4239_length_3431_cov_2.742197_1_plen_92_part_00
MVACFLTLCRDNVIAFSVRVGLKLWTPSDAFAIYDRDKTGFITSTELQHLLKEVGQAVSLHEAEAMIRAADRDGDGKLSFDEFARLHETSE